MILKIVNKTKRDAYAMIRKKDKEMKCQFGACIHNGKRNDGGIVLKNNHQGTIFPEMEPNESMHLECYIRYCARRAITDLLSEE